MSVNPISSPACLSTRDALPKAVVRRECASRAHKQQQRDRLTAAASQKEKALERAQSRLAGLEEIDRMSQDEKLSQLVCEKKAKWKTFRREVDAGDDGYALLAVLTAGIMPAAHALLRAICRPQRQRDLEEALSKPDKFRAAIEDARQKVAQEQV